MVAGTVVGTEPEPRLETGIGHARAERLVKARLRDPESARFMHFADGCGYVNSRNGFGGMSGNMPFIVTPDGIVVFREDDPAAFPEAWAGYCRA